MLIVAGCILTDVASLNVALNKSAVDCNRKPLSKIMFDGDKNQNRSEIMNESCMGSEASVEIDLGGMYYLHYAVVHAGSGEIYFILINLIINLS